MKRNSYVQVGLLFILSSIWMSIGAESYKTVIFDPNTLVDSKDHWWEAALDLQDQYNLTLPQEKSILFSKPLGKTLLDIGINQENVTPFFRDICGVFMKKQGQSGVCSINGIGSLLAALKLSDCSCSIFSTRVEHTKNSISTLNLGSNVFDDVFHAAEAMEIEFFDEDFNKIKGQTEAVAKYAQKHEGSVVVTQQVDIAYALRNQGVPVIGVTWGWHNKEAFNTALPDVPVAETTVELEQLLLDS